MWRSRPPPATPSTRNSLLVPVLGTGTTTCLRVHTYRSFSRATPRLRQATRLNPGDNLFQFVDGRGAVRSLPSNHGQSHSITGHCAQSQGVRSGDVLRFWKLPSTDGRPLLSKANSEDNNGQTRDRQSQVSGLLSERSSDLMRLHVDSFTAGRRCIFGGFVWPSN